VPSSSIPDREQIENNRLIEAARSADHPDRESTAPTQYFYAPHAQP
jgi:hypothetical protein